MTVEREELTRQIDVAPWNWMRAHLERGGIILVDPSLELADAAVAIAKDDSVLIGGWIAKGMLGKPSVEEIAQWDETPPVFRMVVVSPYILAQIYTPDPDEVPHE
ncbi:MAG: DUF2288 domain-containing protein [Desulfuromonas sp.]|nr:MAG: DUF2288 domain-containing protein [Desulfuromonas sp.]